MVKKITYLLLLLLAGHFTLLLVFKKMTAKRSELVVRWEEYKREKNKKNILILGDSHAERGLDISQLPGVTSLAYYGENNVLNYYRLKYCLEELHVKIKYAVLPCDIVTFSKGFNAYRTNKFFYYSLVPFSELNEFEQQPVNACYEYLKSQVVPYAEWQYGLNLMKAGREQKGFAKFSDRSEEQRKQNATHFIQHEMACQNKREQLFYTTALTYLEKTIELCSKNGIKPVFVRYPLTDQVFDEVRNGIGADCIIERPAEKMIFEKKIPILDFERIFSGKPELFFDCHHLNVDGMTLLTPLFKQRLDSLLKVY